MPAASQGPSHFTVTPCPKLNGKRVTGFKPATFSLGCFSIGAPGSLSCNEFQELAGCEKVCVRHCVLGLAACTPSGPQARHGSLIGNQGLPHRPRAPQPPLPHALRHRMAEIEPVDDPHAGFASLLPVQAAGVLRSVPFHDTGMARSSLSSGGWLKPSPTKCPVASTLRGASAGNACSAARVSLRCCALSWP